MRRLQHYLLGIAALAVLTGCPNKSKKLPDVTSKKELQKEALPGNSSRELDLSTFVEAPTHSGLMYKQLVAGNGQKVKSGDIASVHYMAYYADKLELLQNSRDFNNKQPVDLTVGEGLMISGLEEGLQYMRVGDRFQFYIPPHLGYLDGRRGQINPDRALLYDVYLVNSKTGAKPYDISGVNKMVSSSGLVFYKVKQTNGAKVIPGQRVTVHYSGYFTDGKKFDSSVDRGEPFQFNLGEGKVIPGWEEAMLHLNLGEKARFIIPSHLAYGEYGYKNIPPNSDLIFYIELLAAQ